MIDYYGTAPALIYWMQNCGGHLIRTIKVSMVHSDTAPYDYLMGACDNASRIVSYVVVMGQGYASNPLLDMRIHDITLEADITRHVPTIPEPVEADGTPFGEPSPPPQEEWPSKVTSWWTIP